MRLRNRRVVALLLSFTFSCISIPAPAAFAAKTESSSHSDKTQSALPSEPPSQVGVLSGHSWAKSWNPEVEEPAIRALEAKKAAKRPSSASEDLTTHLKQAQVVDDPNNPVAVGLEERLKAAGSESQKPNRGVFWKGYATGVGLEESISRRRFLASAAATGAAVLSNPAGTLPTMVFQPVQSPLLDQLKVEKTLAQEIQVWRERARNFLAGQKMEDAVDAPGEFKVRGYRSYQENEEHPFNRYLGVPRFWTYDIGVILKYLVERGEIEEARQLAADMMDIAQQMDKQNQKGGWRFSYGTTFTDARAMSGATAWLLKELYSLAIQIPQDQVFLGSLNKKFVEVPFAQQVMDPMDPRYGLLRAGFGTGGPEANDQSNKQREEITTEHNWDYIEAMRLAYRAIMQVDAKSPLLAQLQKRHELAMVQSRARLLLTPEIVRQQMKTLEQAAILTAELRAQHEKVAREIERLPGKRRWATGGEAVKGVWVRNLSWAWDNEGWSPHGAFDPEMAYNELRNLEVRFQKEFKAKDFSHLPKGVNPEEGFIGLIFFTGDFKDPHVRSNPDFEKMIQPEATWSYIFRLIQFGYHTADPDKKAWAYKLARRLIDSMLRLSKIYGGAPYATKDIQDYFNTMLSVASNIHQGIVLENLLHSEAPATDYLNVLPHRKMTVGDKSAAWVAEKEVLKKERTAQPPSKTEDKPSKPGEKPVPLKKAKVTDEELTVPLPPGTVGWVVPYLQTNAFYPQEGIQRVTDGGEVNFAVPSGTPERPGWVKAKGRGIAVFVTEEGAAKARNVSNLKVIPAKQVHQVYLIARDGTMELIRGTLPKPKGGLEEADQPVSRREFLRQSLGLGAAAVLGGELLEEDAAAQAPQKAEGALAPLAARLGKDAELGFITWEPIDFTKAVRAGITTVWISGHDFLQRAPAERQKILDRASDAGLGTLGFIDGDPSFRRRDKHRDAQALYTRLTQTLLQRNPGKLRIAFAANVEPHGDPRWNGDLTDYSDLMEKVILPTIQEFADQASRRFGREVVVGPRLTRIEAFWYRNGQTTDDGRRIRGLRETKDSRLAIMSYRGTGAETFAISTHGRARVQNTEMKLLLMAETLPPGPGIPKHITFHGRWNQMGTELVEAIDGVIKAAGDEKYLGGVIIHSSWQQAERVLDTWLAAAPAKPAQPKPKGAAPTRDVELVQGSLKRTNTHLSGQLRGAPPGARVVALLKTDSFYWQPREGASVAVGKAGRFSVETVHNPPNRPGWLKAKEVVILVFASSADVTRFLATYPIGVGLGRIPARDKIKPEPVRAIRITSDGKIETSFQFFQPLLRLEERLVVLDPSVGPEIPIRFQMLTPSQIADAGLFLPDVATGMEEGTWKLIGPVKAGDLLERVTSAAFSLVDAGKIWTSASVYAQTDPTPSGARWSYDSLNYLERSTATFPPQGWYLEYQKVLQRMGILPSQGTPLPSEWFISARGGDRPATYRGSHVMVTLAPFSQDELDRAVPLPSPHDSMETYLRRIIAMYMILVERERAETFRITLRYGPNQEMESVDLIPSGTFIDENEEGITRLLGKLGDKLSSRAERMIWPRGFSVGKSDQVREVTIAVQGLAAGLEDRLVSTPVALPNRLTEFFSIAGDSVKLLLEVEGAVPLHQDFAGHPAVAELAGPRGETWIISTGPIDPADRPNLAIPIPIFIQPEYQAQVELQLQQGIREGWIRLAETVLEKGAVVIGDKAYRDKLGDTLYDLGQIFVQMDSSTADQVTAGFLARMLKNLNPVPGEVVYVRSRFEAGAGLEQAAVLVAA